MSLTDVNATKRKLIDEILDNPVYTKDSGMRQRLAERLFALSKDDLGCLKLIIDLKVHSHEDD